MRFTLVFLILFFNSIVQAAGPADIVAPLENANLTNQRALTVWYRVNDNLQSGDRFVVFRRNGGYWNRVHEVQPSELRPSTAMRSQNLTPGFYFCQDTYAIRLMRGTQTLAGPVHFSAGAGACSGDARFFRNLEGNQVDLAQYQAANQGNRDTCGSFAGVAALEAAYKRLKGVQVRLSQHYMHHIIKSSWLTDKPLFKYENQTSYWGGNDTQTALKFLTKYPVPQLRFAPYQSQNDLTAILSGLGLPQLRWSSDPRQNNTTQAQIDKFEYAANNIAQSARAHAKYGVLEYEFKGWTEARKPAVIETYLKRGQEVMLALNLNWKDHPNKAKTKLYDSSVQGGSHLMLVVGFDRTSSAGSYFLVKNSWGEGVLRMHYDIIKNAASSIGVIKSVRETHWHNPSHWLGKWNMRHDNWPGTLILRRNFETNLSTSGPWHRLGEYQHQNGQKYCVWGGTSEGSKLLKMWIDFDNPITNNYYTVTYDSNKPPVNVLAREVCPEKERGQYFEINLPGRFSTVGTGTTWWNSRPFDVRIWK